MPQLTIQPSIRDLRSRSLLELIERLGAIDLSQILVYRLDSVPDSALILLAWQFDMLAPQWQLGANLGESIDTLTNLDALTNIDTLTSSGSVAGLSDYDSLRVLLKQAIPLHRTRGTPYAVKTALASMGWSNVTLLEGQATWGGTSWPDNQGWAVFRLLINLGVGQRVLGDDLARIVAATNFFKPVRAALDSIWFVVPPISDSVPRAADLVRSIFLQTDLVATPVDTINSPAWPLSDTRQINALYNSHFTHTGLIYRAANGVVVDSGVTVNGVPISARG
jgi:P2-related tail formation protein